MFHGSCPVVTYRGLSLRWTHDGTRAVFASRLLNGYKFRSEISETHMKDQYLVVGNPIAHSKSPIIHAEFAKQTHQNLEYDRELIALDGFVEAVDALRRRRVKGINVTLPFKLEALDYILTQGGTCSARAKIAGAVNTIKFLEEGKCFGDNTDGAGLVRDLTENLHWDIRDKHILILGAGGGVQGILLPLLEQKPKRIVIANRTVEKAEKLAKQFQQFGMLTASSFEALKNQHFDLILNGTAASLQGELPPLPKNIFSENAACYDLAYSDKPTVFLQWAEREGCKNFRDGLGMLVEQAAEAFYIWRGVRPETKSVIKK